MLFLGIFSMETSAQTDSLLNIKLQLDKNNIEIGELLKLIEKKTNISFTYSPGQINAKRVIKFLFNEMTIQDYLNRIVNLENLNLVINRNNIYLIRNYSNNNSAEKINLSGFLL